MILYRLVAFQAYRSGSESSVNRFELSFSGGFELPLEEDAGECPSGGSFDRFPMSLSLSPVAVSSVWFWLFFFFRFRSNFEKRLPPAALALSGVSPAWVLGLSEVESSDERPLLRLEVSMPSKSGGVVEVRFGLFMTWLADGGFGSCVEVSIGTRNG